MPLLIISRDMIKVGIIIIEQKMPISEYVTVLNWFKEEIT